VAVRTVTWLAVAVGGVGGTVAALAGSPTLPAPDHGALPSAVAAPASAAPRASASSAVASAPLAATSGAVASAGDAPVTNSAQTPMVSSASTPTPTATPSARAPVALLVPDAGAESAPLPTTAHALLREEMHCDQKVADACIVAARGYESGSAGAADPEKAVKYRKIAITLWISQCDHNSALACATLADMYRVGRGVPQNDRNADALVARTRELCHYHSVPVCSALPNP
jgi:TPR repeat protein